MIAYDYGLIRVKLDHEAEDGILLAAPFSLDVRDPFGGDSMWDSDWNRAVGALWNAGWTLAETDDEPIGQCSETGWHVYPLERVTCDQ